MAQLKDGEIFCERCGKIAAEHDPCWNMAGNCSLEGTYCNDCFIKAVKALGSLADVPITEETKDRLYDWLNTNAQN